MTLADLAVISEQLLAAQTETRTLMLRRDALVRELYDNGVRNKDLADAAGITKMRVNQIVNPPVKDAA